MTRWLLPIAVLVVVVAAVLASWTASPLFADWQWPRFHPLDGFNTGDDPSLAKLMVSVGRRLLSQWRSGSGRNELQAPGDKYVDALRVIAAWSEQHEADDCVAIVRDARRGDEICFLSQ